MADQTCLRCGGPLRTCKTVGFVDGVGIHGMGEWERTDCLPCGEQGREWQKRRIGHWIGYREAAKALGMDVVTISAIESGMPGPTKEQADAYRAWIEGLS